MNAETYVSYGDYKEPIMVPTQGSVTLNTTYVFNWNTKSPKTDVFTQKIVRLCGGSAESIKMRHSFVAVTSGAFATVLGWFGSGENSIGSTLLCPFNPAETVQFVNYINAAT